MAQSKTEWWLSVSGHTAQKTPEYSTDQPESLPIWKVTITAYLGCLPSLPIWDVYLHYQSGVHAYLGVKVIMAYLGCHRHYRSWYQPICLSVYSV